MSSVLSSNLEVSWITHIIAWGFTPVLAIFQAVPNFAAEIWISVFGIISLLWALAIKCNQNFCRGFHYVLKYLGGHLQWSRQEEKNILSTFVCVLTVRTLECVFWNWYSGLCDFQWPMLLSKQINTKNLCIPFHNQTQWPSYSFPNNTLSWEQSAWEYQTDPKKCKK